MARSTVHYSDNATNNILKRLHNKLRPAGTPVQRVEYIIELLLLRIFEVKLKREDEFIQLRNLFKGENQDLLFSSLYTIPNEQILPKLNSRFFPFYAKMLGEARKAYKGNPSVKVQDQLVLIEEVFSNSNFTNNVQSGNLREIIGLIGELDEELLLKTDLLGDAIESALSETGGTKDIGLHRTPDHVRQFMVGFVQPNFDDLIFDPTAGTAGFLFDSYDYVMQCVLKDGNWPGPKAHPELASWFNQHFAKQKTKMPSVEKTTDFYRTGVMGIEYLGMIRKMAAINFYIRGLNPGNILQGDSLAMFKKEFYPESKTAILANPPFGAERDQDAYPDVWSEYPKESETTILFVKLMLETLKKSERCAVIVSEGFMTWDQNSARALRKSLLDEANLKAIISLPQGVFVSKGGQGPKTSILYFEKGPPTKHVWFYKVTNDGYTMGTNRKQIAGCQLVEALELFDRYVRHGKIPPETKHSFTIPAEWIKTLDPRIKERIRTETRTELTAKAEEERTKLLENLTTKVKDGKLKETEMQERLAQHSQVWENRIHNEIAKRIERVHLFSFNLVNYRSNLTTEQVDAWKKRNMAVSEKTLLDTLYQRLKSARLEELDVLLTKLDPRNALELDIARQFISKLDEKMFSAHPHLKTLADIIASQAKYPRVKLKGLIRLNEDVISPSDLPDARFKVLGVSNETGVFLNETLLGTEIKQKYFQVKPMEFCYNPYRVNVGSIGLNEFDFENQITSGAYVVFGVNESELNPKFLLALFGSPYFLAYVNEKAHGGVRMNFKYEYLEDWEIPLPQLEVQEALVKEIERQRVISNGAKDVLANWSIDDLLVREGETIALGRLAEVDGTIVKDLDSVRSFKYVGGENIESGTGRILNLQTVEDAGIIGPSYRFSKNQIIYSKVRPNLRKCFLADFDGVCSSDIYPISTTSEKIRPQYLAIVLASVKFAKETEQFQDRAGMPKINRDQLATINLIVPDATKQEESIARYKDGVTLLNGLQQQIDFANCRITDLLSEIWER